MSYCNWGNASAVTLKYHDEEWGLPVRDDRRQFEYLMFYGPVTVYSHLQACGIINDHGRDCPRYAIVNAATETIRKRRDHEKGVVDFS